MIDAENTSYKIFNWAHLIILIMKSITIAKELSERDGERAGE